MYIDDTLCMSDPKGVEFFKAEIGEYSKRRDKGLMYNYDRCMVKLVNQSILIKHEEIT